MFIIEISTKSLFEKSLLTISSLYTRGACGNLTVEELAEKLKCRFDYVESSAMNACSYHIGFYPLLMELHPNSADPAMLDLLLEHAVFYLRNIVLWHLVRFVVE